MARLTAGAYQKQREAEFVHSKFFMVSLSDGRLVRRDGSLAARYQREVAFPNT
jgi:hypothetical protein